MINLLDLLSIIPEEDWYRNWPASRTFMLRSTSKKIQKEMDKIRPPVNIRFIKHFRELSPDWYCIYRIKKLEILACSMSGKNKNMLIRLIGQCPALVHLKIVSNSNFSQTVTNMLVQVLLKCPKLEHLNLSGNSIGDNGAVSLAGVIGRLASLKYIDLSWNNIGPDGVNSLVKALVQNTELTSLYINNNIRPDGVKHIDLYGNKTNI